MGEVLMSSVSREVSDCWIPVDLDKCSFCFTFTHICNNHHLEYLTLGSLQVTLLETVYQNCINVLFFCSHPHLFYKEIISIPYQYTPLDGQTGTILPAFVSLVLLYWAIIP